MLPSSVLSVWSFDGDHRRDQPCRLGLHARDHVGVLLQRERGGLVAEAFADHLHRHAGPDGNGCVGAPQVVEPDFRQI